MTTLPVRRGAMARMAACRTKKTPRTLTFISRSYSSGSTSSQRSAESDAGIADHSPERRLGVDTRDHVANERDVGDVELDGARV